MKIYIKTFTDKFPLLVHRAATIDEVKEQLAGKTSILPYQQRLLFGDEQLGGSRTLLSYEVKEGDEIILRIGLKITPRVAAMVALVRAAAVCEGCGGGGPDGASAAAGAAAEGALEHLLPAAFVCPPQPPRPMRKPAQQINGIPQTWLPQLQFRVTIIDF